MHETQLGHVASGSRQEPIAVWLYRNHIMAGKGDEREAAAMR